MRTLRSAAVLLTSATSLDGLAPIAAALGGVSSPAPLDTESIEALTLPRDVASASVVRGDGTLRFLLVEARPGVLGRDYLARLARRLSSRAPHLLWLVMATEPHGTTLALAAWSADRAPPRVVALLADRARLVDSDAETLCALAAARDGVDLTTHARWLDVLGREAVSRRFFRTLERLVADLARDAIGSCGASPRRDLALLYVSRLLFLSFLEAKGWLDGDRGFLTHTFASCMAAGGGFHRRILFPLFFGTLNTPPSARAPAARALGRLPFLNGGLFARTPLERSSGVVRFTDEQLGRLFGELLGRYRFTAREDAAEWSEAAVDPEMLGRTFECLMAARERRASGAFYTPHALVDRVTSEALGAALCGGTVDPVTVARALAGAPLDVGEGRALGERIRALRVLDLACGSGAFLVHVLERLADLAARAGDHRSVAQLRRDVLARSIFGVDVNPTAVWLCELRLWLSVVIESDETDPLQVPALPNLDHHIRVGDALAGGDFALAAAGSPRDDAIARLRARYARASGQRKRTLARALDREERKRGLAEADRQMASLLARRRDLLALHRGRDLFGERGRPSAADRAAMAELRARTREWRASRAALATGAALPFSFATHFADVGDGGGFDLIVGNPPWVRLHNIPQGARARLRRDFVVYRTAAWESGAIGAHAGRGFAAQVDLAALFIERAVHLLRQRGTLALLVPVKLWRALAGGGVRHFLQAETDIVAVEDWSDSPSVFDAAVYPSLLLTRRRTGAAPRDAPDVRVVVHRPRTSLCWMLPAARMALDDTRGSPWLLAPAEVREAFDRLRALGLPLAASRLGRPHLGVKCGCNAAFVVEVLATEDDLAYVSAGGRRGCIERSLLRPLLRGETLAPWRPDESREQILWTHGPDGAPLEALPARAAHWLAPWRRRLASRSDVRGLGRWWSLFRTEAATCTRPRVVWADFGRTTRALVLESGNPCVPLNSCYVVICPTYEDACALAAVLNSSLASAWLELLAEPARGRYRRYLGWTMALLPLPADWSRARDILAPLAAGAMGGRAPGAELLLESVVRAYGAERSALAPLLGWSVR